MFAYTGFSSREDALARAGNDPIALLFWAGEYRKALPLLEQATATALQRGQIALAAFHLTLTARAHATLGDLSLVHVELRACGRDLPSGPRRPLAPSVHDGCARPARSPSPERDGS